MQWIQPLEALPALAGPAAAVRRLPQRVKSLEQNDLDALDADFKRDLDAFVLCYGDLRCPVTGAVDCVPDAGALTNILLELAALLESASSADGDATAAEREAAFLDASPAESLDDCQPLLPLARASHRLRDDDNILPGTIEVRLIAAAQEGRRRARNGCAAISTMLVELGLGAADDDSRLRKNTAPLVVSDRQITGQPAGPGLVRGLARVIVEPTDITHFKI